MTTIKIEIVQTVEQTVEYTFEVPDGYTMPDNTADALDELEADEDASFVARDIIDESVIAQHQPVVTVSA